MSSLCLLSPLSRRSGLEVLQEPHKQPGDPLNKNELLGSRHGDIQGKISLLEGYWYKRIGFGLDTIGLEMFSEHTMKLSKDCAIILSLRIIDIRQIRNP